MGSEGNNAETVRGLKWCSSGRVRVCCSMACWNRDELFGVRLFHTLAGPKLTRGGRNGQTERFFSAARPYFTVLRLGLLLYR